MELVTKILFAIANSLLVPDILLLILFLMRALWLCVTSYNAYAYRRKHGRTALATHYATLIAESHDQATTDYLLTEYEIATSKDLNSSRLLTKLGPILGLVGTLISMSPALVGLSSGDITGMAYNMQVVFSTTVVGLLISAIGLVTQQLKQRWYAQDFNRMNYDAQNNHPKE